MSTNGSQNANDSESESDETPDPTLDRLLSEARWPEPDSATIAGLQTVISSALAEADHPPDRQALRETSAPSVVGHRWSRLVAVVTVAAALLIAFLAGRWTASNPGQSIADVQQATDLLRDSERSVPVEMSSDSSASERHTPSGATHGAPALSATAPPAHSLHSAGEPDRKTTETIAQSNRITPRPDSPSEKRRRLTQRDRMLQQLETVLACLEADPNPDASCIRPLMPQRAEFEFLLGELVRSATGQRQLAAVTALGFVGSDGSVPRLLQSTSNEQLRAAAITAIKRCSSETMLAALVLQLGHEPLAEEYLIELAQRTTPQAATAWVQLVQTPASRDLCLRLADQLSPTLVNILFAELDASLLDDRMAAILSLGRRSDEQTLNRVNRAISLHPGRWEPVAILIWNGSPSAMATLTTLQRMPERYAVLQTASIQLQSCLAQSAGP